MNNRIEHAYRYSLLRYVHDRMTEEFVNVGVVIECPSLGYLGCKADNSLQRLSSFFPGIGTHAIRSSLRTIQTRINSMGGEIRGCGNDFFSEKEQYIQGVWKNVLPRDSSALSWTELRGGVTSDPESTLERIFKKSVGLYKASKDRESRSDADVWGKVEPYLARKALSKKLVEHHVQGALSEYTFSHSLKNGRWHCIEPVSIDLMNTENIRSKVQKIYGAMSLIKRSASDLSVYFVLSDPTTAAARNMFVEAKEVISSVDVKHSVFLESQAEQLASDLAEVIHH